MKTKKYMSTVIGFSLLLMALGFVLWPKSRVDAVDQVSSPSLQRVYIETVRAHTTERTVHFSGVSRAVHRANLSFAVPARMIHRPVDVGRHVKKGQILAQLDLREFKNAVSSTQARVAELKVKKAQAERDRQRMDRLAAVGASADDEAEQIAAVADALTAAYQSAMADLSETQRLLDEATLRAPFDGTITAVLLEPGEWASPGQPVAEISGDGPIELSVEVPESVVTHLKENDSVQVRLPFAGDRYITGHVSSVARAAITAGRLFPVEILLNPSPYLTAGMTAELVFKVKTKPLLTVPLAAIINPGSSKPSLFMEENARVREVHVTVERIMGDRAAVSGPIRVGDRVVISGHTTLTAGDVVEVQS